MVEINSATPITSIMHRHVVTTDAATSARECARRIANEHIGCIIVVRNDRPAGIVTERSFVDLVKKGMVNPDAITAADIMSSPLITLRSEADFAGAMEVFNKRGIKRLPVFLFHFVKDVPDFALTERFKSFSNGFFLICGCLAEIWHEQVIASVLNFQFKNSVTQADAAGYLASKSEQ